MLLKCGWWEPVPDWDPGDVTDLLEYLIVLYLCRQL